MDISEIRRENLRAVMLAQFGPERGAQKRIAETLGCQPDYISRCLTPPNRKHHKNIGEELARDWEDKLGLERYQLDDPDLQRNVRTEASDRDGKRRYSVMEANGAFCAINDKSPATYRQPELDRALLASIIRFVESNEQMSAKRLPAEQKAAAIAGAYLISVNTGATADNLDRHVVAAAIATATDPNQPQP